MELCLRLRLVSAYWRLTVDIAFSISQGLSDGGHVTASFCGRYFVLQTASLLVCWHVCDHIGAVLVVNVCMSTDWKLTSWTAQHYSAHWPGLVFIAVRAGAQQHRLHVHARAHTCGL